MKKALLLSVVASTMIMAGGDIAPVEPVVETPAPVEASGWDFGGKGVVYYQTDDLNGISSRGVTAPKDTGLFSQGASAADAGIQLSATNKDWFAGIGAGVELSGLATLGLENNVVSDVLQAAGSAKGSLNDQIHGGWVSQAYLTYGLTNTSLKIGRQTLPKSLSPFAYSEDWNVFHNTFDSALLVNSSLPDTTLVGAWVRAFNKNGMHADMTTFNKPNGDRGIWMLTAQNKSISNLTLTGSVYYASKMLAGSNNLTILWGDAAYDAGSFGVAVQGGSINDNAKKPSAFGAKLSGSIMGLNAMVAYSKTSNGTMFNVGGSTSALYTETAANQVGVRNDEAKYLIGANMDALGGTIIGAYAYTSNNTKTAKDNEFNLVYTTTLADSVNLTAAYVYLNGDTFNKNNLVRLVASYKF